MGRAKFCTNDIAECQGEFHKFAKAYRNLYCSLDCYYGEVLRLHRCAVRDISERDTLFSGGWIEALPRTSETLVRLNAKKSGLEIELSEIRASMQAYRAERDSLERKRSCCIPGCWETKTYTDSDGNKHSTREYNPHDEALIQAYTEQITMVEHKLALLRHDEHHLMGFLGKVEEEQRKADELKRKLKKTQEISNVHIQYFRYERRDKLASINAEIEDLIKKTDKVYQNIAAALEKLSKAGL